MNINSQLFGGTTAVVVTMLIFITFLFRSINTQNETAELVERSQLAINDGAVISDIFSQNNVVLSRFLLTGDEDYLNALKSSQAKFNIQLDSTKKLVSDKVDQISRLDNISRLHEQWQSEIAQPVITAK
ncbi:MAG: CHASE3 domain-containing protein [bacterium]|nr:CHASE3 domain-containing protein [bacterium]